MPEGKSEYPDEIWSEAKKVASVVLSGTRLDDSSQASIDKAERLLLLSADVIAKALLAERQRCISICDAEREWGDFHPDDVTGRIQRGDGPRQIPGWNCPYEDGAHD